MKKRIEKTIAMLSAVISLMGVASCGDEVYTNIKEYDPNPVIIVPEPTLVNGHECVDLGCSVMWATMNVDAETPTAAGTYFGWASSQSINTFRWPYISGIDGNNLPNVTKYNGSDGKKVLESSDDAATVLWGSSWRTPTREDFQELRDSCYWRWTNSFNNVSKNGFIVFRAKNEADKGVIQYEGESVNLRATYDAVKDTCIFLPAAGYIKKGLTGYYSNSPSYNNNEGFYWTSEVYSYTGFAYDMMFFNKRWEIGDVQRLHGLPIRAVCAK